MTSEEAIKYLKKMKDECNDTFHKVRYVTREEALDMAIKALEQEPCEDCISRAELIDKTIKRNSIWLKITDSRGMNLQEIIDELPSVQPKRQENEDCINRKEAIKRIKELFEMGECYSDKYSIIGTINQMPSVQPKTGHWIISPNDCFVNCSECGLHGDKGIYKHYRWCPNCGAKMVEPQKSEDKE